MTSPLRRTKERSLLIGLIFTFCLTIILARLFWLQTVKSDELLAEAQKQWENPNQVLKAKRGTIYDRTHNEALAWEVTAYTFMADPTQIQDRKRTAQLLSPLLGIPEQVLLEKLSQKKKSIPLKDRGKYKYPREIYDQIMKLKEDGELKGIYGYKTTQRQYNSSYAAHVLGFLNSEDQPVGGVEAYYNDRLKGIDGTIKYKKTKTGMMISDEPEAFRPPVDGQDLVLTIDARIQAQVEESLDHAMQTYRAKGATAIVMDPYTGEILAMASRPAFDPSQAALTYDPEKNGHNMAVESQFEPGSTFKIITLAAAINEGIFNPEEKYQSGSIQVGDVVIRDWKNGGWGTITYREGVMLSSNVAFVKLGQRLGVAKLIDYIDRFGFGLITDRFGRKTGIDLPAEARGVFFGRYLYPAELATTSFGQGISVTPIQQVAAVSAIANDGYWVKPHVLKEAWDPKKKKRVYTYPIEKRQIIKAETARQVRQLLRDVVVGGTGKEADIPGYQVAGKTGTAQKPRPDGGYYSDKYIVSFIGFAPMDHPNVVVYVALDEPYSPYGNVSGGTVAAPVAKEILEKTLEIRQVPKKEGQEPNLK
jgi:cell division protein FtsI/penicillin-binding protein 2